MPENTEIEILINNLESKLTPKEFEALKLFLRAKQNKGDIDPKELTPEKLKLGIELYKMLQEAGYSEDSDPSKTLGRKPIIYFVCAGNICRSVMLEAFANEILGHRYEFRSAGVGVDWLRNEPLSNKPLKQAIDAMKEIGIEIDPNRHPQQITKAMVEEADIVICVSESKAEEVKRISGKYSEHKIHSMKRDMPDPFDGQFFLPGEIAQIVQIDPSLPKTASRIAKTDAAYKFIAQLIKNEFFPDTFKQLRDANFSKPILQKTQEELDFDGQINMAIDEFNLEFLALVPEEKQGIVNEIIAERFRQDLKNYLKIHTDESQNDPNYHEFVEQIISDTNGAMQYSIGYLPDKPSLGIRKSNSFHFGSIFDAPLMMLLGMMRMREYSKLHKVLRDQGFGISNHAQLSSETIENLTTYFKGRKDHRWLSFWKCSEYIKRVTDELLSLKPLLAESFPSLQEHQNSAEFVVSFKSFLSELKNNTKVAEAFNLIREKYFDFTDDEIEQVRGLIAGTQVDWENISKKVLILFYSNQEFYERLSVANFAKLSELADPGTTPEEITQRWEFFVQGNFDIVQEKNIVHLLIFALKQPKLANRAEQLTEKLLKMNRLDKVLEVFNSKGNAEQKVLKDYFVRILMDRLESNSFGDQELQIVLLGLVNLEYQATNGKTLLKSLIAKKPDTQFLKPLIEIGLIDVNQSYDNGYWSEKIVFLKHALVSARDKEKDVFEKVVQDLLDNGGDLNRWDKNTKPPLIRFLSLYIEKGRAKYMDHLEKALVLIENGADPFVKPEGTRAGFKFEGKSLIEYSLRDRKVIIEAYIKFLKNKDLVAKRIGCLILNLKSKDIKINFSLERLNNLFDQFQKGSKLEYVDAIWMLNELSQTPNKLSPFDTNINDLQEVLTKVTEESAKDKPFANVTRLEPKTTQTIRSQNNTSSPNITIPPSLSAPTTDTVYYTTPPLLSAPITPPTQATTPLPLSAPPTLPPTQATTPLPLSAPPTLPPTPPQIFPTDHNHPDGNGKNAGYHTPTPSLSGIVEVFYYAALFLRRISNGRFFPDLKLPGAGSAVVDEPKEVALPEYKFPVGVESKGKSDANDRLEKPKEENAPTTAPQRPYLQQLVPESDQIGHDKL